MHNLTSFSYKKLRSSLFRVLSKLHLIQNRKIFRKLGGDGPKTLFLKEEEKSNSLRNEKKKTKNEITESVFQFSLTILDIFHKKIETHEDEILKWNFFPFATTRLVGEQNSTDYKRWLALARNFVHKTEWSKKKKNWSKWAMNVSLWPGFFFFYFQCCCYDRCFCFFFSLLFCFSYFVRF